MVNHPPTAQDLQTAIFFYNAERGDPTYQAFSNFHPSPLTIVHPLWPDDGPVLFPTVEHWYQANKTIIYESFEEVRTAPTPGIAKKLGQQVPLRDEWEEGLNYAVMLEGLHYKYADTILRQLLLSTGVQYLAEDSPKDFIWGIRDKKGTFGGQNLLGRALMEVRVEYLQKI